MKITLDGIETLEAIQRTGSFAAAAAELHKVQSAVSYTIRQLEDGLGLALFDRSGHRARLTDAGRVVLEEGRLLLARARRLEHVAGQFGAGWEPRLQVVIDGILPQEPLLAALQALADEEVPTQIQLRVEFRSGVQRRFESEGADLMLVKDWHRSESLVAHALPELEVVLVAAAAHPLAQERKLSLAELQRHVELTVRGGEGAESGQLQLFGGARVFYLGDFFTKRQALSLGLGVGWMPLHRVEAALAAGGLRELAWDGGSRYRFAPMLVHRAQRPLGRAGQRLLEALRAR